jgi:ribonuclease PH
MTSRPDGRAADELRPVTFERDFTDMAAGSVLVSFGRTRVVCTASIDEDVPRWMRGTGRGWVTAEYSMLPGATTERSTREVAKGRLGGRTHEIQRLIGRALRAVTDTAALGEMTLWVDCDVLQADGGTRCASITGAWTALFVAAHRLVSSKRLQSFPLRDHVGAVSVGIIDGTPCLDLPYEEDVRASVDMNVVMTGLGGLVEVQGTAEGEPFSRTELDTLMDLAGTGIGQLVREQKRALGPILEEAAIPPLRRLALGPAQLDLGGRPAR